MSNNKRKSELELKLQKLSEREKQLKAQMRAIDAREREVDRKRETRAKIILGGYLALRLKNGDEQCAKIFDMAIEQVQTSCGYAVPLYEFQEQRTRLEKWASDRGESGIQDYWEAKNKISIDGKETGM